MDRQTKDLVAVGAAVATNCQPCLQKVVGVAREGGADERDIMSAIAVGRMVRRGANDKMDCFVAGTFKDFEEATATEKSPCGCG